MKLQEILDGLCGVSNEVDVWTGPTGALLIQGELQVA